MFKLSKQPNKGKIQGKILKPVLVIGLTGAMMLSMPGCNSDDTTVNIGEMNHLIIYVKDILDKVQILPFQIYEDFFEITHVKDFVMDTTVDKGLLLFDSANFADYIGSNFGGEFIVKEELKPLLVAEYGYKAEYSKVEINDLVAKIRENPEGYMNKALEKQEETKQKVKIRDNE